MELQEYFIAFFLLLLAGSIITCGFFAVTRGEWKEEVDGTRIKEGALLKGWWFFWFKEEGEVRTPYKGDRLFYAIRLMSQNILLKTLYPRYAPESAGPLATEKYVPAIRVSIEALNELTKKDIKDVTGATADIMRYPDGDGAMIHLFDVQPLYKFPEWLRTMMAGCITCHASFYGSLIYWSWYILLGKEMFDYSQYPVLLPVATWIAYMLSLAYVNTFLWVRMKR